MPPNETMNPAEEEILAPVQPQLGPTREAAGMFDVYVDPKEGASFYNPTTKEFVWVPEEEIGEAAGEGYIPESKEEYVKRMGETLGEPSPVVAFGMGVGRGIAPGLAEMAYKEIAPSPELYRKAAARAEEEQFVPGLAGEITGTVPWFLVGGVPGAIGKGATAAAAKVASKRAATAAAETIAQRHFSRIFARNVGVWGEEGAARVAANLTDKFMLRNAEKISRRAAKLAANSLNNSRVVRFGKALQRVDVPLGVHLGVGTELGRQVKESEEPIDATALVKAGVFGAATTAGLSVAGKAAEWIAKKAAPEIKKLWSLGAQKKAAQLELKALEESSPLLSSKEIASKHNKFQKLMREADNATDDVMFGVKMSEAAKARAEWEVAVKINVPRQQQAEALVKKIDDLNIKIADAITGKRAALKDMAKTTAERLILRGAVGGTFGAYYGGDAKSVLLGAAGSSLLMRQSILKTIGLPSSKVVNMLKTAKILGKPVTEYLAIRAITPMLASTEEGPIKDETEIAGIRSALEVGFTQGGLSRQDASYMADKIMRGQQLLDDNYPENTNNTDQSARYRKLQEAVINPQGILQRMATFSLWPTDIEVLKTLEPAVYESFQRQAKWILQNVSGLTDKQKRMYEMLAGGQYQLRRVQFNETIQSTAFGFQKKEPSLSKAEVPPQQTEQQRIQQSGLGSKPGQ